MDLNFDLEHANIDQLNNDFNYLIEDNKIEFKNNKLSGIITYDPKTLIFKVNGVTKESATRLTYWAANPLIKIYSYTGSGLPLPNPHIAYENTTNHGSVSIDSKGYFTFQLLQPSTYYVHQGKTLLKPHVHLRLKDHIYTIMLTDRFPYRSLTSLPDQPKRSSDR